MYERFSAPVCAVGKLPSVGAATFEISTLAGASVSCDFDPQAARPPASVPVDINASKPVAIFLNNFFTKIYPLFPSQPALTFRRVVIIIFAYCNFWQH
jgi:hypothetical protein